jgi:hypothetical protein
MDSKRGFPKKIVAQFPRGLDRTHFALAGLLVVVLSIGFFQATAVADDPIRVEVVKTADGWQLLRGGKPYFIKGAGGTDTLVPLLVQYGGNSFREWGPDQLADELDEAQKLGLTVTAGIWLGHKHDGFDYHNALQVKRQLDMAREVVRRYRNHPALLVWAIGNEMENDEPAGDPAVWQAIEDIAAMIKKEDPNHPTMTVIAEVGGDKVSQLHKYCPDIDVVGINSYAGGPTVGERYKKAGGTKPYVITEFGPPGQWEMEKKPWGGVPELSSTEKTDWYRNTYRGSVLGEKGLCLGSYAFMWGNKREASATWYGMFLPDGSKVAAVDTMSELWTGKPVANPCPKISKLKLADGDGQVDTGAVVHVLLDASSVNGDPIRVTWELHRDSFQYQVAAESASAPEFPEAIIKATDKEAELKMPATGGGYRLYAYVRTANNGSAVANLSLYAKGLAPKPTASKAALPLVIFGPSQSDTPYIPSGWLGNYAAVGYAGDCAVNPHSGRTCIKLDYHETNNWGGIVWQSPANDWGDKPGGFNLTGAKKLTFWARGETGGELVDFSYGGIRNDKPFYDTSDGTLAVKLTTDWKQYAIELTGKDLSRIKTGFGWSLRGAGKPVTFYLDDIQYE